MRLTVANNKAIRYACMNYHYARCVPVNPIGFNVYNDENEWCGVILYSNGATPNIGNEYGLVIGQVLELVRVALNGKQETTSKAISMSIRLLKQKRPLCRLIISYADLDQNHLGIIYQATNFIYVGKKNEGQRNGFIVNGIKKHLKSIYSKKVFYNGKYQNCPQTIEAVKSCLDKNATISYTKGKHKYLMPLDKKMRKQIEILSQPYPKADGWTPIDYKTQRRCLRTPEPIGVAEHAERL